MVNIYYVHVYSGNQLKYVKQLTSVKRALLRLATRGQSHRSFLVANQILQDKTKIIIVLG